MSKKKHKQVKEELLFEDVEIQEDTGKEISLQSDGETEAGSRFKINPLITPLSIILAGIVIAGAIIYTGRGATTNSSVYSSAAGTSGSASQTTPTQTQNADVAIANYPSLGSKNAPVTVVEEGDFECPFCKQSFQTFEQNNGPLTQLIKSNKVNFVFRNFPLSFHQNAHMEAEAGYCANDQGKFWQLHDFIYTNTTSNGTGMTEDQIVKFFSDSGWDANSFKSCIDSGKYKAKVDADIADGTKYGVTGTPTYFVGKKASNGVVKNAQAVVGAVPFNVLSDVINQMAK